MKIDFENINQRILALPIPAWNYDAMVAGKTHILYLLESPVIGDGEPSGRTLHKFDIKRLQLVHDPLLDHAVATARPEVRRLPLEVAHGVVAASADQRSVVASSCARFAPRTAHAIAPSNVPRAQSNGPPA